MSLNKVFYQADPSQVELRGTAKFKSAKFYDWSLKKMVEVCNNFDGPFHSVETLDDKVVYTEIPLQRGKKMTYDRNTFYAHIYADQIHQIDCLTLQVKVYELEPAHRVLTAMRYALDHQGYKEAI